MFSTVSPWLPSLDSQRTCRLLSITLRWTPSSLIILNVINIIIIFIIAIINIIIIITRSYAALRAADLDWIVGPGYSWGKYIWRKTMKNQPGTMKNHEKLT